MSKINYAVVFSSGTYRELIYSVLDKQGILFSEPVIEDEKSLSGYVKTGTVDIGQYDAFIIDLGALKDTDEQIVEAVESIRFLDDKVRIIIMEGTRTRSDILMQKFFLNGIYNLIPAEDYINTKEHLNKCLVEGMSYKEALSFREVSERSGKKSGNIAIPQYCKRKIAFLGSQMRMGTTHCVLAAAYTLRKNGYLVAVVDATGCSDYKEIMNGYGEEMSEDGCFTIDDIDFYKATRNGEEEYEKRAYNFIIYDLGAYNIPIFPEQKILFQKADEKILVVGGKLWELPNVAAVLRDFFQEDVKYLFNLVAPRQERDLRKLLKEAGAEKDIYFMEYQEEYFSESDILRNMLQVTGGQKEKRGLFRRKKDV